MGKRPHLEMIQMTARVPRGTDGLWAIIRDLDLAVGADGWSIADVDGRSDVDRGTIRDLVRRLVAGGYAAVIRHDVRGAPPVPVYRLLKSPYDAPRLRRDGSEYPEPQTATLWRTMRMLKAFTAGELAVHAVPDADEGLRQVARRYARQLVSAGVLVVTDPGHRGSERRYRLPRDLGPRAPMILRAHVVFDPNSRAVLGTAETREVTP